MSGPQDIEEEEGSAAGAVRERSALRETRAIYRLADEAYVPFGCPALGECCQLSARGRQPWLWPSEWRLLHATGGAPAERPDGGCPYLDASGRRCSVYSDRPFGCRTFFCERRSGPAREPGARVAALLLRLEAVNQRAWPEATGPRPLLELAAASR